MHVRTFSTDHGLSSAAVDTNTLHDVTWHPFGIIHFDGADAAIQERIQDELERGLDRRVL